MNEKTREKIIAKLATVPVEKIYVLDEIEADVLIAAAEAVSMHFEEALVDECALVGPRFHKSQEMLTQFFLPVAAIVQLIGTTDEEVADGLSRPTPEELRGMIMSIIYAAFFSGVHAERMAKILLACIDEESLADYTKVSEKPTFANMVTATLQVAELEAELRRLMDVRRKSQSSKTQAAAATTEGVSVGDDVRELMELSGMVTAEANGEDEVGDDPRSENGWLERSDA